MGLFSDTYHVTDKHYHNINLPDTIKVHEHKAPTDESIKLLEEMHDKAMKNIIAKVKVDDNLVNGECWIFEQPWNMHEFKLVYKFKINQQEFNIEELLDRGIFMENHKELYEIQNKLQERAKSVMLWYTCKKMTQVFYEKITGQQLPDYLIK